MLGIALLVVAIGVLMAVGSATTGVFNAALYRYATTGETSGAFTQEDMAASFRPKRGGGGGAPADACLIRRGQRTSEAGLVPASVVCAGPAC